MPTNQQPEITGNTDNIENDEQRDILRVYNLVLELKEARQAKKIAVREHTEEINRIQAEIEELINKDNSVAEDAAE